MLRPLLVIAAALIAATAAAQNIDSSVAFPIHGYQQCLTNQAMQDSQGNIYITASDESGTITEKWSKYRTLIWRERLPMNGATFLAVDNATGTVYIAGGGFAQSPFVHAITSGGTALWSYSSNTDFGVQALTVDQNGNVYAAFYRNDNNFKAIFDLVKLDGASGALKWTSTQDNYPQFTKCLQIAANATGHLYSLDKLSDSSGNNASYSVVAYDPATGQSLWTSGVLAYAGVTNPFAQQLYIAPSGNADVIGSATDLSNKPLIAFYGFDAATGAVANETTQSITNDNDPAAPTVVSTQDASGNLFYGMSDFGEGITQYGMFGPTGTVVFSREQSVQNTDNRLFSPSAGTVLILSDLGLLELDSSGNTLAFSNYTPFTPLPFPGTANGFLVSYGSTIDSSGRLGLGIYNSSGALIHSDYPTGPISGETNCVASDPQGNLYVATETDPGSLISESGPMFVSRLYPNLKPYWSDPFPISGAGLALKPQSLKYDPSSGDLALLAQQTDFSAGGVPVAFVAKLSIAGSVIWATYDQGLSASTYDVRQAVEDANGNVVAVGTDGTDQTLVVTSYAAADGSVNWRYRQPGANSVGTSVAIDGNGNIYAGGYTTGANPGLVLIKLSSVGAKVYDEISPYGVSGAAGASMVCDSAGNQYVAYTSPGVLHLVKVNPSGASTFRDTYAAGTGSTQLGTVLYDAASGKAFVAVLTKNSANNDPEVMTYKIASTGVLVWSGSFDSGFSGFQLTTPKVALDSSGNLISIVNVFYFGSAAFVQKFDGATGKLDWNYRFVSAPSPLAYAVFEDVLPLPGGKFMLVGATPDTSGQVGTIACAAIMH